MKRIVIIEAGLKPGWTKRTADAITDRLVQSGAFECERIIVRLESVSPCRGCALCLERGEGACRFHDDAAQGILDKLLWADGIVTVTPNYSLQVPGILKILYDRLAFVFHRPRLFGRVSLAIVVQGVYGGGKIVKYIDELMTFWGCSTIKGAVISGGLYPNSKLSADIAKKNDEKIAQATDRLMEAVLHYREKTPSLFRLALFRMTRSSMKYSDEALAADRAYYAEHGWYESRYYTPVHIGPVKRAFGALIDRMIRNMILKPKKESVQT